MPTPVSVLPTCSVAVAPPVFDDFLEALLEFALQILKQVVPEFLDFEARLVNLPGALEPLLRAVLLILVAEL